ncbi:Uncharacterised protein [Mycobacterium tuberculosis]|nr:Uncharacterised protein [Mycobacterium tuberculosis]
MGDPVEHFHGRLPGGGRQHDGCGHQPPSKLVLPLWKAEGDVAAGPAIQLGGPPGAGAGPAGQARVLGIQQVFGSEPVQMEFRLVARDADGVGRLVSAHRHRL